jgi:hypothetical protein
MHSPPPRGKNGMLCCRHRLSGYYQCLAVFGPKENTSLGGLCRDLAWVKTSLRIFFGLLFLGFFVGAPVSADDTTSDSKPGFFHRLGDAIFHGTHKLEKSDTVDASGRPAPDDETTPKNPAPSTKKPAAKKPATKAASKPVTVAKDDDTTGAKDSSSTKTETDDAKSKPDSDKTDASNSSAQTKDYPIATQARKPGFVKSPFPPYHELDATGMISGSLARDPITGKIFRVP